jgi:hypothetical protein
MPGLPAYPRSKTIAERAAWDFIEREGGETELVVVNPTFILGPAPAPGRDHDRRDRREPARPRPAGETMMTTSGGSSARRPSG